MSNEMRKGDIIPDSTRRKAIGAIGKEDLPCYEEMVTRTIVEETTVEFVEEEIGCAAEITPFDIVEGNDYVIVWNGVKYECQSDFTAAPFPFIGNPVVLGASEELATEEPFCVYTPEEGIAVAASSTPGPHTFSISVIEPVVHKLDPKYLPDGGGTKAYIIDIVDHINGEEITVELLKTVINEWLTGKARIYYEGVSNLAGGGSKDINEIVTIDFVAQDSSGNTVTVRGYYITSEGVEYVGIGDDLGAVNYTDLIAAE